MAQFASYYDGEEHNASQIQPNVYPVLYSGLSDFGQPSNIVLPTSGSTFTEPAPLAPWGPSPSETSLFFPEIGTVAAQHYPTHPTFDYGQFDPFSEHLGPGHVFDFSNNVPEHYGLVDDMRNSVTPDMGLHTITRSSPQFPELQTPTTVNPAATIGQPASFTPSTRFEELIKDLTAITSVTNSLDDWTSSRDARNNGAIGALPTPAAQPQKRAMSTARASKQAAQTKISAHVEAERVGETSQGGASRGKKRAVEEEEEDDDDDDEDQIVKRKSKRSKQNREDGDTVLGFACPYSEGPGSTMHCNVLLGTANEVPRHMLIHLIEEETKLRHRPDTDPTTLVFGGRPSNRPRCPNCNVQFARKDSLHRHMVNSAESAKSANKKGCSKPVGMHGKYPKVPFVDTQGAAAVEAKIWVRGKKSFIASVVSSSSHWSPNYCMKRVGPVGEDEEQPVFLTTDEVPRRGMMAAYTAYTPPPPPLASNPSAEDSSA